MGDEQYLEPNRKAQIIFVLYLVLAAATLALLAPMIPRLMPSQSASLEELKAAASLMTLFAFGTVASGFIISLLFVAYIGRLGYRTLKVGSYPPPGTIVIRRTRVRTGRQAVLAGYLSISVAVLVGLSTVVGAGYAAWLFARIWRLTSAL